MTIFGYSWTAVDRHIQEPQTIKKVKLQIPRNKTVMDLESKPTSEAADWVVDRLGLGTNCCQPTGLVRVAIFPEV